MNVQTIRAQLRKLGDKETARNLQWFFKTGPGEYGEGDVFIGIRVPQLRQFAKSCQGLSLSEITELLQSPIHEERSLALLLLIHAYQRGDQMLQKQIYELYLQHTPFINNWDLVDLSAAHIIGAYLASRSKKPLATLARSQVLWERRIAIMATFYFIKQSAFADTFRLAKILLGDREDLIHKAVGWMLREVGNRDRSAEEEFLQQHYTTMPRTMLRYAIEKFPESLRQQYLKGEAYMEVL